MNRFFFAPKSPVDLAVNRIVFFAGLLLLYATHRFWFWAYVPADFWTPITLVRLVMPHRPGAAAIAIVQGLWILSVAASCIGLLTRWSMWIAALLGTALLALQQCFSKIDHADAVLVFALIIFALSRAGDALSADAWRERSHAEPSGEYRWPIRAIWIAISFVFLAAGIAKLRHSGLAWIFSDNLRTLLLSQQYIHVPDTRLGIWLAAHPRLCQLLAASTIAVEISYIASVFSWRARLVLVPAMAAMQVGIAMTLGPHFWIFILMNLLWIPWEAIASRTRARSLLAR